MKSIITVLLSSALAISPIAASAQMGERGDSHRGPARGHARMVKPVKMCGALEVVEKTGPKGKALTAYQLKTAEATLLLAIAFNKKEVEAEDEDLEIARGDRDHGRNHDRRGNHSRRNHRRGQPRMGQRAGMMGVHSLQLSVLKLLKDGDSICATGRVMPVPARAAKDKVKKLNFIKLELQ